MLTMIKYVHSLPEIPLSDQEKKLFSYHQTGLFQFNYLILGTYFQDIFLLRVQNAELEFFCVVVNKIIHMLFFYNQIVVHI